MSIDLPEGWQEARFGKLAKEVRTRGLGSGPYPVLSVTKHRGFVRSSEYFTKTIHSADTEQYKLVRKGQFAYATIHLDEGSIDLLQKFEAGLISPMYTVFEVQPGVLDPFFALRSLKRLALSGRFAPYSNGGVNRRRSIAFRDLAAYKYQYPPYPEQLAIAEVLQSVEDAIARKRELIAQLERTADAVFQDALYPGGVPKFPLTKFGDAIESTKYGTSVKTGKHSEGYAVLGIPNIVARRVKEDVLNRVELSEKEAKKYSLKSGDLLAVRTNGNPEYVGRMALIRDPMPSTIFASYLIRIRLKKSVALPEFIEACAPRWPLRISLTKSATTSAGNFNINTDGISQAKIILPSIDVQQQVVKIERAFQDRIEAENRTLSELQNTRAALAQELLSGRLRLPASMIARFENAPPTGKTPEAVTA